ncbi:Mor transcription activator family protein [Castellaniella caeni]|uniref:Mor transcription activator family protein n=1 Tax=Castellaniella caeni TaxID=266123 RepID=UPI000C9FF010|nr:Mor transcription activator family protein [Castellaniella caeni]
MSNHQSGRMNKMENLRIELFSDLIDHVQALMVADYGMSEDAGEQVGVSIVEFLSAHWAGIVLTIPRDYKFQLAKRDLEMYYSHKGDFTATALKWGLTERGARKVIERVVKRIIQKNQGRLFDDDPVRN